MTNARADRVAERIREEMADILRRRLKDPRVGFVSVTSVEVTHDLRHARIFVSVLGDEADKRETQKAFAAARGFIRSELGQRLGLFRTPEIDIRLDESIAIGARVDEILHEVKADHTEDRDG